MGTRRVSSCRGEKRYTIYLMNAISYSKKSILGPNTGPVKSITRDIAEFDDDGSWSFLVEMDLRKPRPRPLGNRAWETIPNAAHCLTRLMVFLLFLKFLLTRAQYEIQDKSPETWSKSGSILVYVSCISDA